MTIAVKQASWIAVWVKVKGIALGLQSRVTVLIVLLTLVVTGVSCGLYVRLARNMVIRLHADQAVQSAAMAARAAAHYFEAGQTDQLVILARDFASGYPLVSVAFSDASGREIASHPRDEGGTDPETSSHTKTEAAALGSPLFLPADSIYPPRLQVTYPVQRVSTNDHGQNLLGYVRVGLGLDRMFLQSGSALDLATGIGFAALLLTIPLAFLLVRRVVVPINEISMTATQLAAGDLTARSRVRRSDEIGQLAASFNTMADKMSVTHQEALELNETLERRVRERTRQLSDLADRDPLTGLYNRRFFNEVLTRQFSEAVRYDNDLSCLMLDVDDFKAVNDRVGHSRGDDLLQLLAAIICSELRAADLAARFGGDEFMILLPQTDADRSRVIAERVLGRFETESRVLVGEGHGSVSIGIASLRDCETQNPQDFLRAADLALYDAKERGKNRVALATTAA